MLDQIKSNCKMRLLNTFFILIFSSQIIHACSCIGPVFSSYLGQICGEEKTLIFKGSYIQKEALANGFNAMQFKVESLYHGQVVTIDSPIFEDDVLPSTDSTVWILSGSEASCFRYIYEQDAIFALKYLPNSFNGSGLFGYIPTICENDYFPISESNTITGRIFDAFIDSTLNLLEFEDYLDVNCSTTSVFNIKNGPLINPIIYPQPASNEIRILETFALDFWQIDLINMEGKKLKRVDKANIDISELVQGVYFLRFTKGGEVVIRKFIKI